MPGLNNICLNLMYVEACQGCPKLFQPLTSSTCFDIHKILSNLMYVEDVKDYFDL